MNKNNLKFKRPITPAVAVDVLIFSVIKGKLKVLMIKIIDGPYQNKWALPGGLVGMEESLEEAAIRVLSKKAGVNEIYLEQLATFGDLKRDIRSRSISVAYFALVNSELFSPKTTEYYADIDWQYVEKLPSVAFDHKKIIEYGRERLISKLSYSNVAYGLLAKEFTLTELQNIYEAVIGKELDKRNFRKKILEIKLVKETGKQKQVGASRPAKLYTFADKQLRIVDVL